MEMVTTLLAFAMLFIAVMISASPILKTKVDLYRLQALALTFFVLAQAWEPTGGGVNEPLVFVSFLPLLMVLLIKPILARVTLVGIDQQGEVSQGNVELTWLQHGRLRLRPGISFLVDSSLTAGAFIIAYHFGVSPTEGEAQKIDPNILAVSMALLLLGLFTMVNSEDILAQIIGLLVVEHGLFLAAVKGSENSSLAYIFAPSLFFYIVLTLTILLWILPALRERSGSLRVDEQRQLRG